MDDMSTANNGARILTLDIESAPNLAHVWGMFRQTVSLNQLMQEGDVIAFAAKWVGEKGIEFRSDFHDGHDEMIKRAWQLLNECDILITYNGIDFDVKHLNKEFWLAGLGAPSPYQNIDLLLTIRKQFRFVSNKLDHIASRIGLGKKTAHEGHALWVKCLAGDEQAWKKMRVYNKRDVFLTEQLYFELRGWISGHPNLRLFSADPKNDHSCSSCAGLNLVKQGVRRTKQGNFQTYQCKDCGSWSTDSRSLVTVQTKAL
jgi:DNA polymerase elongation subunit (family B)